MLNESDVDYLSTETGDPISAVKKLKKVCTLNHDTKQYSFDVYTSFAWA